MPAPKKQTLKNAAPGPRIVNERIGDGVFPRTLQPGETAEGDFVTEGPVFEAMVKDGDFVVGPGKEEPVVRALSTDPQDPAGPEAVNRASLDLDRLTPPAMFGGDGGPEQMPTVNEQGGALTPAQEEKGRKEAPVAAAAKVAEPTPEQKQQLKPGPSKRA